MLKQAQIYILRFKMKHGNSCKGYDILTKSWMANEHTQVFQYSGNKRIMK